MQSDKIKGTDLNLTVSQILGTPENIQNNSNFSWSEDEERYYFDTYLGQLTYEKANLPVVIKLFQKI